MKCSMPCFSEMQARIVTTDYAALDADITLV